MTDTPLTDQQLDEIDAAIAVYQQHPPIGFACCTAHPVADAGEALIADLRRARNHVAKLETYALGCDAEGCTIPHSSWCEVAKKAAAANNGCTCPQPWKDSPQPHAGYCWLLSPPRNEVEEARKRIAELAAENAKLIRWHREDETALNQMRDTIVRLRAELAEATCARPAVSPVSSADPGSET